MATKKRRRRRTTARRPSKRRTRRRSVTVHANPARRRRRRVSYRRNPGFSVKGVINRVKEGAIGGVAVVGGEMVTRAIRKKVLTNFVSPTSTVLADGTMTAAAADIAIATGVGIVAERFVGRQIASDVLKGGFASVIRQFAKDMGVQAIKDVLSDGGPRILPAGRRYLPRVNGYGQRAIAGYVGTNAFAGETEDELGY